MRAMNNDDLLWLAGLLEGEGSFSARAPKDRPHSRTLLVQIHMTDRDVIERAARLMGSCAVYVSSKKTKGQKSIFRCYLTGHRACELMRRLLPHMGERRTGQINKALVEWENRPVALRERRLPATCHPDRPHKGNGLCEYCYRRLRYLTKDIPQRAAARSAKLQNLVLDLTES